LQAPKIASLNLFGKLPTPNLREERFSKESILDWLRKHMAGWILCASAFSICLSPRFAKAAMRVAPQISLNIQAVRVSQTSNENFFGEGYLLFPTAMLNLCWEKTWLCAGLGAQQYKGTFGYERDGDRAKISQKGLLGKLDLQLMSRPRSSERKLIRIFPLLTIEGTYGAVQHQSNSVNKSTLLLLTQSGEMFSYGFLAGLGIGFSRINLTFSGGITEISEIMTSAEMYYRGIKGQIGLMVDFGK
jgi:hypothetical protein